MSMNFVLLIDFKNPTIVSILEFMTRTNDIWDFILFVGVLCWSLFCYALLYVLSSFVIILTRKRDFYCFLLLLFFGYLITVNVM